MNRGVDPQLIVVTVPGAPVAKGRPRISTRGGFARAYTPAKTARYEDLVRIAACDRMNGNSPVQGQVTLCVTAYVPIPKSMPKRDREAAVEGLKHPVTRPDADNYAKAALDGCNGILFKDDSQVTDLIVRKRYSDRPRLVISMEYGE
ncbi:RusA family crossover junction endodeoxyribonuclease [Sphingomonas sp.]|uniref:RusA family crossover junction endodeoxyribonuclease n=1 Tax=Sphingomonas sp. TaxID=28214 RepID=UPI0031DCE2DB